MVSLPRYKEIDMSKYDPSIPPEKREAYYGLPKEVKFCSECVMSNQKPNSCYEFEHTIDSIKKTMVIQDDGVCDACHACHNKENHVIDWKERERELRELCDEYRKDNGSYDCLVPGSGGKDSFYAAHLLKYKYGMHPLTVTWAPHMYTRSVGSSRAELHDRPALSRSYNPVRFCSYEALMVELHEYERLHELRLYDRSLYSHDRLMREYRITLRNGPDIAAEFKLFEIVKKVLREAVLAAEILDVLLCELQIVHVSDDLLEACHYGEATAVRYTSEKHIETRLRISDVRIEIAVCHRNFIEIRQHGEIVSVKHLALLCDICIRFFTAKCRISNLHVLSV